MSASLPFPMPLSEKYRPHAITDFVGLDKPKRILAKFAAHPYQSAWLFNGPPGTGKTTMALALAETLKAEVHHIPSQDLLPMCRVAQNRITLSERAARFAACCIVVQVGNSLEKISPNVESASRSDVKQGM